MKLKFYILSLVITLNYNSLSQVITLNNNNKNSKISYLLKHPLHDVYGTSKNIEVSILYDREKDEILEIIAKVKNNTFSSGNSNRDSHAMELINAYKYPYTYFKSKKIQKNGSKIVVSGDLTFNNITKEIEIDVNQKKYSNKLEYRGNFVVNLDKHSVQRPTLLFIKSDENLYFDFIIVFDI